MKNFLIEFLGLGFFEDAMNAGNNRELTTDTEYHDFCFEIGGGYFKFLNSSDRDSLPLRRCRILVTAAQLADTCASAELACEYIVEQILNASSQWKGGWRRIEQLLVRGSVITIYVRGFKATPDTQKQWRQPYVHQAKVVQQTTTQPLAAHVPVNVMYHLALHSHELHSQFMRHDPYRRGALGLDTLADATRAQRGYVERPLLRAVRLSNTHAWRRKVHEFPAKLDVCERTHYSVFTCPLKNKRNVSTLDYWHTHSTAFEEHAELHEYDNHNLLRNVYQQGVLTIFVIEYTQDSFNKSTRLFCKMYYDKDEAAWLSVPYEPIVKHVKYNDFVHITKWTVPIAEKPFIDLTDAASPELAHFPCPLTIATIAELEDFEQLVFPCKVLRKSTGDVFFTIVEFRFLENTARVHHVEDYTTAETDLSVAVQEHLPKLLEQLRALTSTQKQRKEFFKKYAAEWFVPMPVSSEFMSWDA